MIITSRFLTIYGLVSVLVMAVAFALTLFEVVPENWTVPLFVIALLAFIGRIVTRVMYRRQKTKLGSDQAATPTDTSA